MFRATMCPSSGETTVSMRHSRPKHVEKRKKHTKKNCAQSWLYLQDHTGMHGQQIIKKNILFVLKRHPQIALWGSKGKTLYGPLYCAKADLFTWSPHSVDVSVGITWGMQEGQKPLQYFNPLNAKLNPICYLLALVGAHHFLHVNRIRVKSLTLRLLMSYIYIWSTYSWCF